MNPNELRIGNWVRINQELFDLVNDHGLYSTPEFKIEGFNDGSRLKGCKVICYYRIPSLLGEDAHICSGAHDIDIEPIPLTEEWLIRFGFTQREDGTFVFQPFLMNIEYRLKRFDETTWVLSRGFINYNDELKVLKYVHSLQNIYFELEDDELKWD